MDLGKSGWLSALIAEAAGALAPAPTETPGLPAVERAKERLLQGLHPSVDSLGLGDEAPTARVVRLFVTLSLDLAALLGAKKVTEPQLLCLFAALVERFEEAESLLRSSSRSSAFRRVAHRVEEELSEYAISLAGDPAYGLALHNAVAHLDAQAFGRNAIQLFCTGALSARASRRRHQVVARQKAVLADILVALSCVDHLPSPSERRIILRQLEQLRLPDAAFQRLRTHVKKQFERMRPLEEIIPGGISAPLRRLLLEQTLLASLVDGRRSTPELGFLHQLATALHFNREELAQVEMGMARYYARNRSAVDVFTVSAAAMGEELVASMQEGLEKNFFALVQELRETGELSLLLAKAARGQKLTEAERKAMRDQLIDLAKAIPALAIFAAPGGLFLLMALAKVLPFNLLPSAFHGQDDKKA